MATAPTIAYLLLDAQNDPVFIPSVQLTDAQAVTQAIYTRLNLFRGEWWEDLNLGLPVFQSIVGQLGSNQQQAAIDLAIRREIEAVPYVTAVLDVQVKFEDGKYSFTATAQTAFGVVTVANTPGMSASLDT